MSTFIGGRALVLGIVLSVCCQAGLAITIDEVSLQVDTGDGTGLNSVPGFPTTSQLQAQEGKRFNFDLTDYGFGKLFSKGQAQGFIDFSESNSFAILSKGLSITADKPNEDLALALNVRGHYFTQLPTITEEVSIGGFLQNGFSLPGGGASRVGYDLGLVPFIGHRSVDLLSNVTNMSTQLVVDGIPAQTKALPIGTRIDFTDVLYVDAELVAPGFAGEFARSDFYETATEQLTAVPEPASGLLLPTGLAVVLALRRRLRAVARA